MRILHAHICTYTACARACSVLYFVHAQSCVMLGSQGASLRSRCVVRACRLPPCAALGCLLLSCALASCVLACARLPALLAAPPPVVAFFGMVLASLLCMEQLACHCCELPITLQQLSPCPTACVHAHSTPQCLAFQPSRQWRSCRPLRHAGCANSLQTNANGNIWGVTTWAIQRRFAR